jgi:hypothetical protein
VRSFSGPSIIASAPVRAADNSDEGGLLESRRNDVGCLEDGSGGNLNW